MFNLNEYINSMSIESINLITLKYYSSKSDIMNIYDTNFDFDENIVPLITSVLELKPNIINAKRYCNINSESIITISNENEIPNKSQLTYPCFFSDLQQNKLNSQNIQGYTHNLINTIQLLEKARTQIKGARGAEALVEKAFLIRMYKLENKKGEFNLNILNEEEIIIILWNLEFANFQIVINKKQPKKCQMHINIYITEDNNIIVSNL